MIVSKSSRRSKNRFQKPCSCICFSLQIHLTIRSHIRLSKLQTSSAQLSDTVGLCLIPQLCTYSLDIGSKKKARKVVSFITYIVSFCTEIKFVLPFLQSFKSIAWYAYSHALVIYSRRLSLLFATPAWLKQKTVT